MLIKSFHVNAHLLSIYGKKIEPGYCTQLRKNAHAFFPYANIVLHIKSFVNKYTSTSPPFYSPNALRNGHCHLWYGTRLLQLQAKADFPKNKKTEPNKTAV